VVKVDVKQGEGSSPDKARLEQYPIPIPHPTNLALFGHKITLYRFNQGGSYYCRGLKSERGLSPLTFNHWDLRPANLGSHHMRNQ